LESGNIPKIWKMAEVMPISKKGKKTKLILTIIDQLASPQQYVN
jgi:hypothetical protein